MGGGDEALKMGTLRGLVVKLMADSSGFISGVAASVSATASAATQIGGSARKIGGDWAAGGAQAAASQQKMALEAKQLNNEIVLQTERLNTLRAKFDEHNPRVEKARLNIEALKLKVAELGKEQQTASEHTSRLAGLVESASGRIGGAFSAMVSGAGRVLVALTQVAAVAAGAFAAGIGVAATAMMGAVKSAADWGDQLDTIGDVLGTNASDSAALSVAILGVGGDVNALTTQMGFMSRGLTNTKGELGTTGQAIKELGISVYTTGKAYTANVPVYKMTGDEMAAMKTRLETATARYHDLANTIATSKHVTESQRVEYQHLGAEIATMQQKLGDAGRTITKTFVSQGPLKDTTTLLHEIATKIDVMPDGIEKTNAMMSVFGKTGKDLSDTMHAIAAGGLEEARQKAKLFGLDIGEDGVSNAVKFKRSLAEIKMMGQGLSVTLGSELMPVILPLIRQFSEWAISVIPSVKNGISQLVTGISQFVIGLTTGQGRFGNFGKMAQSAFVIVKEVVQNVITWVRANWPQISAIIGAVLAGVGSFVSTYLIPAVTTIAAALGAAIAWVQANWPQISTVIQGVFNAIDVVVRTVIIPIAQFLISQFEKVVGWVQANWPLMQSTISVVFNAIKSVVEAVLPLIVPIVEFVFNGIKTYIETTINTVLGIIKSVMQAINGDWAGAWQTVQQTVIGIFNGIDKFFGGIPSKLLEMGRQMIAGLVQGILADGDKVVKALSGLIDQAIAGIKTLLGIKSPSTVMAGIGANMALGLVGGYSAALKPLALPGFERGGGAFSGASRVANMRSQAKDDRAIVIHVHNEIGGKEVDNHIIRVVNGEIEGGALRYG